jgi:hypothetical protein
MPMDDAYQELKSFKFQANLLYAASILKKKRVDFKSDEDKLFVKPQDHAKALAIIDKLDLDESPVSDESDGYLEGYKEWTDKQYVNGYFTGGKIPNWMNSKMYAKYFGPYFLLTGVFILAVSGFKIESAGQIFLVLLYSGCGLLMTIRGFKKQSP